MKRKVIGATSFSTAASSPLDSTTILPTMPIEQEVEKAPSSVLTLSKPQRTARVRLGFSLLRPRWKAFLNILRDSLMQSPTSLPCR